MPEIQPANDALTDAAPFRGPSSRDEILGAPFPQPATPDGRALKARRADFAQLQISAERRSTDHVIALRGELDIATAQDVEDALSAAEATDANQITLDLTGLNFIDSSGIHLILTANTRSTANGGRLRLRRGPPAIQRVFDLSGTANALPFAE